MTFDKFKKTLFLLTTQFEVTTEFIITALFLQVARCPFITLETCEFWEALTTTETPRGTVKYSFTAGLGDSRDPYNHWDEGGHRHRQGESRKRGVGVVGGHDALAVKDDQVPLQDPEKKEEIAICNIQISAKEGEEGSLASKAAGATSISFSAYGRWARPGILGFCL